MFYFNSSTVRLKANDFSNTYKSKVFQFLIGTIKRIQPPLLQHFDIDFNSSTVRLKVTFAPNQIGEGLYFNSSTVRLKVTVERKCFELFPNFNSSTVRLKVLAVFPEKLRPILFQFLNGTIKSF